MGLEKLIVIADDPVEQAETIIAVGCTLNRTGTKCSPMSRAIALQARERFLAGEAKYVLFVGNGYTKPMPTTEARAMAEVADLPPEVCFFEERSHTTRMNALEIERIMTERGWKSAIVVAQQLHARRVRWALRKASDKKLYVVKAWSRYGDSSKWFMNYFLTFLAWDTASLLYFKLRGWA